MTLNRLPLEIELVIASEPKFWSLDPNIIEDRGRLIVWAISVGKMEILISGADKEHLLSESSLTYGIHDMYLTNLAVYLHDVRDDLKEAFDLSVKNENQLYGGWFDVYGIKSENIHVADSDENKRFGIKAKAKRDLSEGVNLIGLPKAELGIGEDIRMMVQSCLKAGVPFDLYEYPKTPLLSRQADRSIVDHINNKQSKKINIFCLPAFETIRSYTDLKGPVFDGYYNIGYWPWELPYWPDKWLCALDIVDEIWCSTNFIADSLRKLTKKPVMVMPMAVELQYENIYQTITRKSLGLKEDSYTFLNVFDGLSFPSRKNVMAVLKSFVKAFPQDSEESVQLLIKTMNLYKLDSQLVDDVSEIISNDDRIILFDETVDKSNLIQLYSVCDAYISLHRSEGFGRTIAEAMLLNKPVIVSNFSGNTDFCNENNSYLVTGKEIKVGIDEYHFTDNRQYWFDVDYDDAANKLLECYKDQSGSLERSYQAKKNIENNYNADVIGQNYRKRLVEISGLNFDTGGRC